ncbi:hypothetical protein AX774_g2430 [Zancudomyces culisetae]|uniref:Sulfate transporter n=1 Tax=Zancudomyces culisetae TaxID=1213189 RepID=A0A1R1PSY6_ZANCU|nr:hypothetical protein AX774_g2430 [Zancudomyces culisetae]|eukprot:OMH84054.1 hypothetical protein AX774_g2430 [Zancudomyces culisetae]
MSSRGQNNSVWGRSINSTDLGEGAMGSVGRGFRRGSRPDENEESGPADEIISKSLYLSDLGLKQAPFPTNIKPVTDEEEEEDGIEIEDFDEERVSRARENKRLKGSKKGNTSGMIASMLKDTLKKNDQQEIGDDELVESRKIHEQGGIDYDYISQDGEEEAATETSSLLGTVGETSVRVEMLGYEAGASGYGERYGATDNMGLQDDAANRNGTAQAKEQSNDENNAGPVAVHPGSIPWSIIQSARCNFIRLNNISAADPTIQPHGTDGVDHVFCEGGNGLMMVEILPFLYQCCSTIMSVMGSGASQDAVLATTMVSYALGTILTGLAFLLMGLFKVGKLVDFFPRHILVGCIGGVGYFLVQTGFEVMARIPFEWTRETLAKYFEYEVVVLWGTTLLVAILLRVLSLRFKNPTFVPLYFVLVPIFFYMITFYLGLDLETLRETGWVYPASPKGEKILHYLTLFKFHLVSWEAVMATVPTLLGLAFFGILHVPINAPALAVSINMDKLDTDRELIAHGVSNLASGLVGSFQNYLCYSNSVLFYRSGGDSRVAGFMLAFVTFLVLIAGPQIIGFIPKMVAGALIFHLGLELMKEALIDTIGKVNSIEYITISTIVVTMATVGFNEGIFLGIFMACVFFILLYSRRNVVWRSYTGKNARSTVRRLYRHRLFLDHVAQQIHVIRLQGFMFFGTITGVEETIRALLRQRNWEQNPIRFLVLDFAFVTGMDFSAAEAFIRLKRVMENKQIHFVLCGVAQNSEVYRALKGSNVWIDSGSNQQYTITLPTNPVLLNRARSMQVTVSSGSKNTSRDSVATYLHTFEGLNESLEWCENYLLDYYTEYSNKLGINSELAVAEQQHPSVFASLPISSDAPSNKNLSIPPSKFASLSGQSYSGTPRQEMLTKATKSVLSNNHSASPSPAIDSKSSSSLTAPGTAPSGSLASSSSKYPRNLHPAILLLSQALQQYNDEPIYQKLSFLGPYFTTKTLMPHETLWEIGDSPAALYLVKSGVLKMFELINDVPKLTASIITGTLFGELSLLMNCPYPNTVIAVGEPVELWCIDKSSFEQLCSSHPAEMLEFVRKSLNFSEQFVTAVTTYAFN